MTTQVEPIGGTQPQQAKTLAGRLAAARHTLNNALIITRREVRDSLRDWRIVTPIILLTLLFPGLATFAAERFSNFVSEYGAELIGERTLPFMLMIVGFFPISISLVIALETFVGEKERRSLEPLLATPLTNVELYIGKTLAAMLPPLLTSYGGMVVYLSGLVFGAQQWRPEPGLILQIVILTGIQALVMVTAAVVISSQTTSVRAANLLASFVIIPMALLVQFESIIMFFAGYEWLTPIIVGLVVTVILLIRVGARLFNREEMLGRELDELNPRWAWRVFWETFRGRAANLWDWWRVEVFAAAQGLRRPAMVVIFCLIIGFAFGYIVPLADPRYQLPLGSVEGDIASQVTDYVNLLGGPGGAVLAVIWQNGRVLLAGLLLSIFTFGVMGLILALAPFGVMGGAFVQFVLNGISPVLFLTALLPHSLVEVPAVVLATAAALRLGVVFVNPPPGKTVGRAWLETLARTLQIWIGLVLPMLVLAAFIEVYITPALVGLIL